MPVLVHLAPAAASARIRKHGIRRSRATRLLPAGVYAMPVSRSFHASHQWLRELKRSGQRTVDAIYFRVPDEEPVWFGHYGAGHVRMPAREAAGHAAGAASMEGFEILVPRRIEAGEILRVKALPQVVGWRYDPGAHGRRPCGCPACLARGEIRSRKIRDRYESEG
jgi:hypothetical protein